MKTQNMMAVADLPHLIWLSMALMVALLSLVSCSNPIEVSPTVTSVGFEASPTPTKRPSPEPTEPRMPRITPTHAPTPIPTITPTSFSTLESQAKLNYIVEALKTNQSCELPCWWGITPGKTTWDEMVTSFTARSIRVSGEQEGQLDLGITVENKYVQPTIDVVFQNENGLVKGIDISTAGYNYVLAQPQYDNVWKDYVLAQVLSRYGVPTQVYLELTLGGADWTPGFKQYFHLWIVYEDQGIAIGYPGQLVSDVGGWYACPVFGIVRGIEIRLQSPGDQTPLVNIASEDQPFILNGSLQDLTGMSLRRFYDTFKQSSPQGCMFVTDSSSWYGTIVPPGNAFVPSPRQEENALVKRLTSNSGCELPCWWGIVPGKTTSQSAQRLFLQLGKSVAHREDPNLGTTYTASLFGRHSPYPFDYVVEHRWYDHNGIVYLFGVTGYSLNWSPPQHFTQDWQRYSLHEALTRYGQPSHVLLHYWNFGWQYSIGLVYEDKGFVIQYVGLIIDEGKESSEKPVIFCPTQNRPTSISIWMTDPTGEYPITQAFAEFGYGYPDPMEFYVISSLEEVSGISMKTFYETFLNPDASVCLTVPRNKGDMAP